MCVFLDPASHSLSLDLGFKIAALPVDNSISLSSSEFELSELSVRSRISGMAGIDGNAFRARIGPER